MDLSHLPAPTALASPPRTARTVSEQEFHDFVRLMRQEMHGAQGSSGGAKLNKDAKVGARQLRARGGQPSAGNHLGSMPRGRVLGAA